MKKILPVLGFILAYFTFWMWISTFAYWWTSIPYAQCWFTWHVVLVTASIGWIPGLMVYLIVKGLVHNPSDDCVVKQMYPKVSDVERLRDARDFIG
jgi:hypothetical protein